MANVNCTFTAADGTTLGGFVVDSGQTLSSGGNWDVQGNKARFYGAYGDSFIYLDTGLADATHQVTLATTPSATELMGLTFRSDNILQNRWRVLCDGTNIYLYKETAGTQLLVHTVAQAVVASDVLKVVCAGSSITVFLNGGALAGLTDTSGTFGSQTYAGVSCVSSSPTTNRFDDWTVTAAAGTPAKLLLIRGGALGAAGLAFRTEPQIGIYDASNNLCNTSTLTITATLTSGTGALIGTVSVAAVAGVATMPSNFGCSLAGAKTITFSQGALTTCTDTPTIANVTDPVDLVFSVQPSASIDSEVVLPQQPTVTAKDYAGATATSFTGVVSLNTALGKGVKFSKWAAAKMNAVAGVAAFTGAFVSSGQSCTMVATAPGMTSAVSAAMVPTAIGGRDVAAELPRVVVDPTPPTYAATYTLNPGLAASGSNFQTWATAIAGLTGASDSASHRKVLVTGGNYAEMPIFPLRAVGMGWLDFEWDTPTSGNNRVQPLTNMVGCPRLSGTGDTNGVAGFTPWTSGASIAHHYRFKNIDFAPPTPSPTSTELFNIFAVWDGAGAALAGMPDFIGFDGCMFRGTSMSRLRRALFLGCKTFFVVNSYFADTHSDTNGDTQAISISGSCAGPGLIKNNYLEAAGEIIMSGGSNTPIADLVCSDVQVIGNHFRKPLAWKYATPGVYVQGTSWQTKNLLELKSARRWLIEGNVFENEWNDAQYVAIVLGSADQLGTSPWQGNRDITFRFNQLRNICQVYVISGENAHPIYGPTTVTPTTSSTGGTGLAPNTQYFYKVTAICPANGGLLGGETMAYDVGASNEVSITTGPGATNSNALTCNAVSAATSYRWYRGTSSNGESVYYTTGSPSFTDTGAAGTAGTPPTTPVLAYQVVMHRVSFHDNYAMANNLSPYDFSSGHVVQIANTVDDLSFVHNTTISDTGTALDVTAPPGVRSVFDYNLLSFKQYGISGSSGGNYGAQFTAAFVTSRKNVVMDLDPILNAPFSSYDQSWGNSTLAAVGVATPTTLTGAAARLATFAQLRAAATLTPGAGGSIYNANHNFTGDGRDVGCDMAALATAVAGATVSGEGTLLSGDLAGLNPAADHLAITRQPSATTVSNTPHALQPQITVQDVNNGTVTGDTSTVTASLIVVSGSGVPIGTPTVVAVVGIADFVANGLGVNGVGTFKWRFTDGALTLVDSAVFVITASPVTYAASPTRVVPPTFAIKQGDTAPPLIRTLTGADGVTPQNLTGATVRFSMRLTNGPILVSRALCSILFPATSGQVQYTWQTADTVKDGTCRAEFEATLVDGSIITFPDDGYHTVTITPQIA